MTTPTPPTPPGPPERPGGPREMAQLAARPLPTPEHRLVASQAAQAHQMARRTERAVREAEGLLASAEQAHQQAVEAAAGLERLLDSLDAQQR